MSRLVICTAVLLVSVCSHACFSQAPIERREPPPPLQPAMPLPADAQWPGRAALHHGTRVLVYTFDGYEPPFPCRVYDVTPDRLICEARGRPDLVTFDRRSVSLLEKPARPSIAKYLVQGGLIVAGLGLFCAVDGGPVCVTPGVVGLSMIAAGFVVFLIETAHHWGRSETLYQAPLPTVPAP